MILRYQDQVETPDARPIPLSRLLSGPARMFTGGFYDRHVWIVIFNFRAAVRQQAHEQITGRLAFIIHVRLVSNAQNQNATASDGFAVSVQSVRDAADHILRHPGINLARPLDASPLVSLLAPLPAHRK